MYTLRVRLVYSHAHCIALNLSSHTLLSFFPIFFLSLHSHVHCLKSFFPYSSRLLQRRLRGSTTSAPSLGIFELHILACQSKYILCFGPATRPVIRLNPQSCWSRDKNRDTLLPESSHKSIFWHQKMSDLQKTKIQEDKWQKPGHAAPQKYILTSKDVRSAGSWIFHYSEEIHCTWSDSWGWLNPQNCLTRLTMFSQNHRTYKLSYQIKTWNAIKFNN